MLRVFISSRRMRMRYIVPTVYPIALFVVGGHLLDAYIYRIRLILCRPTELAGLDVFKSKLYASSTCNILPYRSIHTRHDTCEAYTKDRSIVNPISNYFDIRLECVLVLILRFKIWKETQYGQSQTNNTNCQRKLRTKVNSNASLNWAAFKNIHNSHRSIPNELMQTLSVSRVRNSNLRTSFGSFEVVLWFGGHFLVQPDDVRTFECIPRCAQ